MTMDISDTPMCEDHPDVPAEALCIKHKQFVCLKCAVDGKKHTAKKCESKTIRNLTSENDLKLVSLLAMKCCIMKKKGQLEKHISNTDEKTMEVRKMVEQFQLQINEEVQKKVEAAQKSVDNTADAIQKKNKNKMEKVDSVNALFDTEIDRLTSKKGKVQTEEGLSLSKLKENALKLPFTDLRISHGFVRNEKMESMIKQPTSLGEILLFEDEEEYEELDDTNTSYLEPMSFKKNVSEKNAGMTIETYDVLEVTSEPDGGGYKQLTVVEAKPEKEQKKHKGIKFQPLPATPYENLAKTGSGGKLDIAVKSAGNVGMPQQQPVYTNQDTVKQNSGKSPTSPVTKPMEKKTDTTPTPHPLGKTTDGRQQSTEPPRRSSSLLEKVFRNKPDVLRANSAEASSITPEIKNKSVTISGLRDIKRRITKLTLLSSNRAVLLDELNSAILLVKIDSGRVISEKKGDHFIDMVGIGRDTVAVLGRGNSLQVTIYLAMGERKMEEQRCTKIEPSVAEVSGFEFDSESGECAISGSGRIFIVSDAGKTKNSLQFNKCLTGKEGAKDLKTTYDFHNNSIYILNTLTKNLKRFEFGSDQVKWETKIENNQCVPQHICKGQNMIYISYQDCIKSVAIETGKTGKVVKTKDVLGEILGLFVDEATHVGIVSSAASSLEGSNMFAVLSI